MPSSAVILTPPVAAAITYSVEVTKLAPSDRLLDFTHRAALFVAHKNSPPERRVSKLGRSETDAVEALHKRLQSPDCRVPNREAAITAVEAFQQGIVA